MATKSIASTVSPLIAVDDPMQTLAHVKGVLWFLTLTASDLAENGSNDDATHGLTMILECAAHAVDHATLAMEAKAVHHG